MASISVSRTYHSWYSIAVALLATMLSITECQKASFIAPCSLMLITTATAFEARLQQSSRQPPDRQSGYATF